MRDLLLVGLRKDQSSEPGTILRKSFEACSALGNVQPISGESES